MLLYEGEILAELLTVFCFLLGHNDYNHEISEDSFWFIFYLIQGVPKKLFPVWIDAVEEL